MAARTGARTGLSPPALVSDSTALDHSATEGTTSSEVEYFLNEETEGVLTDCGIYLYDQHLTWLSQLKPNVKVG